VLLNYVGCLRRHFWKRAPSHGTLRAWIQLIRKKLSSTERAFSRDTSTQGLLYPRLVPIFAEQKESPSTSSFSSNGRWAVIFRKKTRKDLRLFLFRGVWDAKMTQIDVIFLLNR
jgi:hypothetical protein